MIEAFRWTASGGMVVLGDLPGGASTSAASAVSSSGSVVVGGSASANGIEAFRWTQAGGMVGIGDLPGGRFHSVARDVSADGAVVVGTSLSANGEEAFRWTAATGMVGLRALPNALNGSVASGVSADGSVVVGYSDEMSVRTAFFWTSALGMVSLKQYLLDNYAASLPPDFDAWNLMKANAISPDGSAIVGEGIAPDRKLRGWLVRLPAPPALKWTPVDVAVCRTDNTSRLLWKQSNGRYAVWKVSASGVVETGAYYGPVSGYTCEQIAVAPNGETTLLWKNPTTKDATLWTLTTHLSRVLRRPYPGVISGYTPQNIAADQNNKIWLTMRGDDNALLLLALDGVGGYTRAVYGPYANLEDGPLAVGEDGKIRLLWRNTATGGATVWTPPAAYNVPPTSYNYGPVPGAYPADIAVGADNKTRLQWRYADGKIAVWKLNTTVGGNGVVESGKFYGPFAGVSPLGLSVGGDNQTRQLWKYDATGKTALWVLNDPLTTINAAYTYGPIP